MKRVVLATVLALSLSAGRGWAGLDTGVVETPEMMRTYAASGDAASAFNYGITLAKGEGMKPDAAQAAVWFRRSAVGGFAPAQLALGVLLAKGEGVPKDEKEAVRWIAAAGAQGLFEAQKMMMVCFTEGVGGEPSAEKALVWEFLARRSLEVRFEQLAGAPPPPATLRADGFAEYRAPDGRLEALGPDGSVERVTADGTRVIERPDGGVTKVLANGERQTKYPDGHSVTEFPDGRKVTRDRQGMAETKYPDGTREVEGEGTVAGGRAVKFKDRFDKDGKRIARRVVDGAQTIEELPDGGHVVETTGEDEQGRTVQVFETYEKNGAERSRRLVRADGAERAGDEIWVITRTVRLRGGEEARVRQKFGRQSALYEEVKLATDARTEEQPKRPPQQTFVVKQSIPMTVPAESGVAIRQFERLGPASRPARVKVPIDKQLAELAKLERAARYFAGATPAQYESARAAAERFIFELPQPPQKPLPANVAATRFALRGTAPPLPAFVRLATDRSELHPLGLHGRVAIKLHPWQHTETEHFVVHYTDPREAYSVMADIECTFINVTQTLQLDPAGARQKSHVFIFPNAAAWKAFKEPLGLPGPVEGFAYKAELYLGVREDREKYLHTLCHEAAHAVVARYYPARKWPLWLNEGFAEYMSGKQLELRRTEKPGTPATRPPTWQLEVDRVFYRTEYALGADQVTLQNGARVDSTALFYAESQRCVRALIEKLPPRSFPRFANLVFAGNSMPVCLREAYGVACATAEQFQALVNQ